MSFEVGQRVRFKAKLLSTARHGEDERRVGVVIVARELPANGWRVDIRFSDTEIVHGVDVTQVEPEPHPAASADG